MTKFKPWAGAQVAKPASRAEMAKALATSGEGPRELVPVVFPVLQAVRLAWFQASSYFWFWRVRAFYPRETDPTNAALAISSDIARKAQKFAYHLTPAVTVILLTLCNPISQCV